MGTPGADINITIVYLTLGFLLFALFLIAFIAIYRLRLNRHLRDKLKMKSDFEQALLLTQVEIQEQTLKNISEEIHDNVGQILSLAKLHLNTFPEDAGEKIDFKVAETKKLVSKAINDLRNLSHGMHGEKITDIGLQQAIASEMHTLQNTGQFTTRITLNGDEYKLDKQKQMVLFRIVQESLHNAQKHSGATALWVELHYLPGVFRLLICDNGKGFDAAGLNAVHKGIGLKNMQNRAALIGGKLTVHSSPGEGVSITVDLPSTETGAG
ncbi:MAG TPA: sensor histidine kinase [Ferruginibacter sp.]|nr:sensor histidine kinase [Ferruginibacter sp.]HMP22040.1 sensor histidine kinase [Ferruginibacter sp.]